MNGWISVKDKLPEYKNNIILYAPGYSGRPVRMGWLDKTDENGHNWRDAQGFGILSVTHWMPLPEPPEK